VVKNNLYFQKKRIFVSLKFNNMVNNRNFPTGSQYFQILMEDNAIYVDKTQFIVPLLAKKYNAQYFLSRPRRFGKSLFLSTLEQVFLGKKELFKGLYIEDKIDWDTYPVIRLSMDKIGFFQSGLEVALYDMLKSLAREHGITLESTLYSGQFGELIQKIAEKHQKRVVLLIDEYDKPIITYIEKDGVEEAERNRDILKSFYGVLKNSGDHLRFLFITGVSKFSRVSIFSDLNHLTDLTLNDRYNAICGFTETELRHYCYGGLEDLAEKEGVSLDAIVDKIRYWYDGFSWNAKEFVYNPYSTMLLMDSLQFKNYWADTGTPTFLAKLINEAGQFDFTNMEVKETVYNWHDLKNLDYISIMLQTGYLTFKEPVAEFIYKIGFPNREVEQSFSELLLERHLHKKEGRLAVTIYDIEKAFKRHDIPRVLEIIADMFKTLPSQFFKEGKPKTDAQGNTTITQTPVGENFYHAVIYLVFKILGVSMQAEVTTQKGRIDALVETDTHIYVFEFKKNRKASVALEQIKDNKYAEHFALSKKQIYLIGVAFNLQKRGISDSKIQLYDRNAPVLA
jgi:Predicted AAA-ATPase/PD-(D/E)XK nuclease superfamily